MKIALGEYMITARGGQFRDVVEIIVSTAIKAEDQYQIYRRQCGPGGEVQIFESGGRLVSLGKINSRANKEREKLAEPR